MELYAFVICFVAATITVNNYSDTSVKIKHTGKGKHINIGDGLLGKNKSTTIEIQNVSKHRPKLSPPCKYE